MNDDANEPGPLPPPRRPRFVFLGVSLCALTVSMAALLWLALDAASGAGNNQQRRGLYMIAWMSMAMMCLALLLAAWLLVRWLSWRAHERRPRISTPYVDAWALAGKRIKVEPQEESGNQDDDTDDHKDRDGNGD